MQPGTYQALLFLADISGFTKFMKLHTITVTHAKQIIVKLLESIIKTAMPPLRLIELEGDAVFFYAACYQDEAELDQHIAAVKTQLIGFFRSFYEEMLKLCELQLCLCEACISVKDLRLKIVLHSGEVAVEHIQSFEKLFGIDVIVAHRLLKNSIPAKEYILITKPVYNRLGDFYALKPEIRNESYDGIGRIDYAVFYPPFELIGVAGLHDEPARPNFWSRLRWYLRLDFAGLMDILGIRKLRGKFIHLPQRQMGE
jgi:class 3 adenylate cyclase